MSSVKPPRSLPISGKRDSIRPLAPRRRDPIPARSPLRPDDDARTHLPACEQQAMTLTRRRVAAILFFLIAGYGLAARDTISDARWIAILWLSWFPLLVAIWPDLPPTVPHLGRSALRMTMIFLSILTLCAIQLLRV